MTHNGHDRDALAEPSSAVTAPLSLPAGLTALADEISIGRSAAPLQRLAVEVQQGRSLADAAVDPRVGLPAELRELLRAGAASGQLMEVADRYSAMIRRRLAFRRELCLLLLYPTLLFCLLFFVGMINALYFQPMYMSLFAEFRLMIPPWIVSVSWLLGPGLASMTGLTAAVVLLLALTWRFGGKWAAHLLRQAVPLLGPVYRYQSVSEFAELLGLFVASDLPLPNALRCAAMGMSDMVCAKLSGRLAESVEGGCGLGQALDAQYSILTPLAPLVTYGEQHGVLPDALDALAEMYAGRTEVQANLLRIALPPALVLVVASLAGLMFAVVMLPLFQLIVGLT